MNREVFNRADVIHDHQHSGQVKVVEEKGSMPTPLDFQLLRDAKRVGWYMNPSTLKTKLKRCRNCGRIITKPRRQKFCCDACRYAYNQRKYRERKRLAKINRPILGFYGELYVIFEFKGKPTYAIIPALYARSKEKAMEYVEKHYTGGVKERIKYRIAEYYDRGDVQ